MNLMQRRKDAKERTANGRETKANRRLTSRRPAAAGLWRASCRLTQMMIVLACVRVANGGVRVGERREAHLP
jgi:hypothetical protein